MKFCLANK